MHACTHARMHAFKPSKAIGILQTCCSTSGNYPRKECPMWKMPLTARRVESSGAAGPLLVNPGPVLEWSITNGWVYVCMYLDVTNG